MRRGAPCRGWGLAAAERATGPGNDKENAFMTTRDVGRLRRLAAELRLHVVRMMGAGAAHHFGGSMSAADIITALYFDAMRFDPKNPTWPRRDRFIMSKGHCVPTQYAALAMLGVLPLEELGTLKQLGSRLQGHPAMHLTPGLELHRLPGAGIIVRQRNGAGWPHAGYDYRVYCLLGDGETQEGQVWGGGDDPSRTAWGT